MTSDQDVHAALSEWIKVFMTRSMRDLHLFLRSADLSMGQYGTLIRLYHHHERPCGVGDVGSHLGITNAAASQLVDKLVQQGLLERTEDPDDRRSKRLALTPGGKALVEASLDARLAWTKDLVANLSPDRREAIRVALLNLVEVAEADEKSEAESQKADPGRWHRAHSAHGG